MLFQSADLRQVVFSGDDTKNGDIVDSKNFANRLSVYYFVLYACLAVRCKVS